MAVASALPATYPTAAALIISLLSASPALAGVSVNWGGPDGSSPDEFISLGGGRFQITSAAIGSQRREERGTIEIMISVLQSTGDQSLTMLRAFSLRDTVASILRQDATLGNGGNAPRWALDEGYEVVPYSSGTRSETRIKMTIGIAARI